MLVALSQPSGRSLPSKLSCRKLLPLDPGCLPQFQCWVLSDTRQLAKSVPLTTIPIYNGGFYKPCSPDSSLHCSKPSISATPTQNPTPGPAPRALVAATTTSLADFVFQHEEGGPAGSARSPPRCPPSALQCPASLNLCTPRKQPVPMLMLMPHVSPGTTTARGERLQVHSCG